MQTAALAQERQDAQAIEDDYSKWFQGGYCTWTISHIGCADEAQLDLTNATRELKSAKRQIAALSAQAHHHTCGHALFTGVWFYRQYWRKRLRRAL